MENILDDRNQLLEPQKFYLIDNKICKYLGIDNGKHMFSDILAEVPIFKSSQELINTRPILYQMYVVDNLGQQLNPQNLYLIEGAQYRYLGQNEDEYMFRNTSNKDIKISFTYLLKNPPMFLKVGGKRSKKQKNKTRKRNKSRRVRKSRRY